jgi:hypothetical protein
LEISDTAMSQRIESAAQVEYERLKQEIDHRFPAGRFVAIEAGNVIADGVSHRELVERLAVQGKSPQGVLIVQAGVEYPKSAIILLPSAGARR